jgi:hypothetical protein
MTMLHNVALQVCQWQQWGLNLWGLCNTKMITTGTTLINVVLSMFPDVNYM